MLLQVLFHARIAEDAAVLPFGIDDVADSLVRKLVNRVPAVLAGEPISLEEQLAQWEERKAQEASVKARVSSMDDVPTGQPALALTQKVYERVIAAGLPVDLIPEGMVSIGRGSAVTPRTRCAPPRWSSWTSSARSSTPSRPVGAASTCRKCSTSHKLGAVSEEEWRAHWPTRAGRRTRSPASRLTSRAVVVTPWGRAAQENSVEPQ